MAAEAKRLEVRRCSCFVWFFRLVIAQHRVVRVRVYVQMEAKLAEEEAAKILAEAELGQEVENFVRFFSRLHRPF